MAGPVLWVLCGAGRRVGKTTLGLDLCRVLPGAVYAKQGTSRRRKDKPGSYFRDDEELDGFLARETAAGCRHLVVESNALAKRGHGDIIIYLELGCGAGAEAGRGARPDAPELRTRAHLRLGCARHATVETGRKVVPAGAAETESASGRMQERARPGNEAAPVGTDESGIPAARGAVEWGGHLARLGLDPEVEHAVIGILAAQDAWNSGR